MEEKEWKWGEKQMEQTKRDDDLKNSERLRDEMWDKDAEDGMVAVVGRNEVKRYRRGGVKMKLSSRGTY